MLPLEIAVFVRLCGVLASHAGKISIGNLYKAAFTLYFPAADQVAALLCFFPKGAMLDMAPF